MVARGYTGGGSAAEARPPKRLPSATSRGGQVAPDRSVPPKPTPATIAQNARGEWVPAVPLPLYARGRKRCQCGQAFWTGRGYRGHYALAHILGLE